MGRTYTMKNVRKRENVLDTMGTSLEEATRKMKRRLFAEAASRKRSTSAAVRLVTCGRLVHICLRPHLES